MKKGMLLLWLAALPAFGELKFDGLLKEADAPTDAQQVVVDFPFRNEGPQRVVIRQYDAPCPCMKVQVKGGKLAYEPGEAGVIRAVFDLSQLAGTVEKETEIFLEGDPAGRPSIRLTSRIHIPVLVEIEPKTATWDIGSSPEPKTITLTMNHSEPIHVKGVSGSHPNFTHELRTVEEGKKYELIITPADTGQVCIAVFHIETDCPIARHRTQRAFSVVRKPAEPLPAPVP